MPCVDFFSGLLTAGLMICSLLLARLWKRSRDELFLTFVFTFALLALAQTVVIFPDGAARTGPGSISFGWPLSSF
jgi:hypothetical protein